MSRQLELKSSATSRKLQICGDRCIVKHCNCEEGRTFCEEYANFREKASDSKFKARIASIHSRSWMLLAVIHENQSIKYKKSSVKYYKRMSESLDEFEKGHCLEFARTFDQMSREFSKRGKAERKDAQLRKKEESASLKEAAFYSETASSCRKALLSLVADEHVCE
nr:uncharacterized protein LOC107440736 [Parasteatoda tepidariorum]